MTELPLDTFRDEMTEMLAGLEAALLEMEGRPGDGELISRVFRALHTIKGSSAMFGFEAVASFAHEVETVFDLVRNGRLQADITLINLLLACEDHISALFAAAIDDGEADSDNGAVLIAVLREMVADSLAPAAEKPAGEKPVPTECISRYLPLLTDYETSRLKANFDDGKQFYRIEMRCQLERMGEELAASAERLRPVGETVSTIPNGCPETGLFCFTIIFASSLSPVKISELIGAAPVCLDMQPLAAPPEQSPPAPAADGASVTYRLRFRPPADCMRQGLDPLGLIGELRELGKCLLVAQTGSIPPLENLDPTACYTGWDAVLTTTAGIAAVREVFIFLGNDGELVVEPIDDSSEHSGEDEYKRLGEILVERGDLSATDLDQVLASQKRLGELLVESSLVPQDSVQSALLEQQHVKGLRQERQVDEASSLRVATEKLDSMVNLVGELIIAHERISQTARARGDSLMISLSEEIGRLATALRDDALNIRMVPVGTDFSRFRRMVRDLSRDLGKDVEIEISGADTELDKTIIDKLHDPMMHIIRNSVDHGIELPEVRESRGKPRTGQIRLTAIHSGGSVLLTIRDDGAGLSREAILEKALEKGLLPQGTTPTDKELFACLFLPGFSTARTVTGVSGRGVGMDVVKKVIDGMRGEIELQSTAGEGTVITIRLPLTLAIIDSLLVKVSASKFVIPLSLVEECVEISSGREDSHCQCLTPVRGQLIPCINLREKFSISGHPPALEQLIVTQVDGTRIGFLVDKVIGEHQTVIKPLGRLYRDVSGFSGATILGDGKVALILDIPRLVRQIEEGEVH